MIEDGTFVTAKETRSKKKAKPVSLTHIE